MFATAPLASVYSALLPLIDVTPTAPPGVSEKISLVLGWLAWGGGAVAILGFIAAGVMVMLSNNSGQSNEASRYVARVAIGAVIVTAAAALGQFITGV